MDFILNDNQTGDKIAEAESVLENFYGSTVQSDAALKSARKALRLLREGLVTASMRLENG